jgi:uncharacterized protein (TIGR02588 family)
LTHRVARIEWVLYVSAGAIVLATLGAAVLLDLTGPHDEHPRVVVQVDGEPWEEADALSVPWIAENPSSWDVEQVQIEVRAGDGEPVTQEIDYLPRGSSRRGVARVRPGGEPAVEVVGYRLP